MLLHSEFPELDKLCDKQYWVILDYSYNPSAGIQSRNLTHTMDIKKDEPDYSFPERAIYVLRRNMSGTSLTTQEITCRSQSGIIQKKNCIKKKNLVFKHHLTETLSLRAKEKKQVALYSWSNMFKYLLFPIIWYCC